MTRLSGTALSLGSAWDFVADSTCLQV